MEQETPPPSEQSADLGKPTTLPPGFSFTNPEEIHIDEAKLKAVFESDFGIQRLLKGIEVAREDYAVSEQRCRNARDLLMRSIKEINKQVTKLKVKLARLRRSRDRCNERLRDGVGLRRIQKLNHDITIRKNWLRRREAKKIAAEISEAYVKKANKVR